MKSAASPLLLTSLPTSTRGFQAPCWSGLIGPLFGGDWLGLRFLSGNTVSLGRASTFAKVPFGGRGGTRNLRPPVKGDGLLLLEQEVNEAGVLGAVQQIIR